MVCAGRRRRGQGKLGLVSSNRSKEPGQGRGSRPAYSMDLVDEETGEPLSCEALEARMEGMAEMVRWPPAVLVALKELEAVLRNWPADVGRQALAAALWRSLSGIQESDRLWFESVTLRDGGRRLSLELLALFPKAPG